MEQIIAEFLRSSGPLFGLLAVSALFIDRFIKHSRDSSGHDGSKALKAGSALLRAHQFYSLRGLSPRRAFFRIVERALILLAIPVIVYGLGHHWYPDDEISTFSTTFQSNLGAIVLASVALATAISVCQTEMFLYIALRARNSVVALMVLLGDVFLSIKIAVFTVAAVVFVYLVHLSWQQEPSDRAEIVTQIATIEGSALGNNFVAAIGYPEGKPELTVQSKSAPDRGEVVELFLGHDAFQEISSDTVKPSELEFLDELGFDASFLRGADFHIRKYRVEPSRIDPSVGAAFSNIWSFYDNIEDAFFVLLSGKPLRIQVHQLLEIGTDVRRIEVLCVDDQEQYVLADSFEDERCSSYVGVSGASLYATDYISTWYARDFLDQYITLSIILFPPVLASAIGCWLIVAIMISDVAYRLPSEDSITLKIFRDHVSLAMVVMGALIYYFLAFH